MPTFAARTARITRRTIPHSAAVGVVASGTTAAAIRISTVITTTTTGTGTTGGAGCGGEK